MMEQKKKVLLVDDDVIVCKGLRQLIPWEELGVGELLECHNGQEAYEAAVRHMPDLIISDIRMPIMDGLSLCEKLCETMLEVPVILLSAYEEFEYARTAIRFGVHDYFLKPMNKQKISELIEVIRNILYRKKKDSHSDLFDSSLQKQRFNRQLEKKDKSIVAAAIQYIEEHYGDENLSVSYLSEMFHFTPSYFSDLFKKKTQMSPNAYITEVRIRKACDFLEQPFSRVTTVAKQVGFRDPLYFSKVFKKYCGMSPSDYQNLDRG